MADNYILQMKNISKSFPGVKALKSVDFKVGRGEVHCLIGANGAGKSTLMKVLAGVYEQDEGEIFFEDRQLKVSNPLVRKKAGISVIYQELSLVSELSVAENIFLNNYPQKNGSIAWKEMFTKAEELIGDLKLDMDSRSKISQLSIGQRQLVEMMKALSCDSKLIVMDEPSATLSKDEFETLIRVIKNLKEKGITIIYISHRLEELFIVGDNITVMRDGKVVATLPTKEMTIDKLVENMIGYSLKKEFQIEYSHEFSDEVVIELSNITNRRLRDVSLKLHKGEILGMYGLVGSGRTEILRSIYGVDSISKGKLTYKNREVRFKSPSDAIRNGIGLLPENRKTQGLVLALPIWENASMVALKKFIRSGVIRYGSLMKSCGDYVTKLNIVAPSVKVPVRNLSGGNQQKVILAKWLMKDCDVLLIDEPTQGIDVGAKREIYKIIKGMAEEGKSIIIASSELEELMQVCNNIAVMYEGKVVNVFPNKNLNEDIVLQAAVQGGK